MLVASIVMAAMQRTNQIRYVGLPYKPWFESVSNMERLVQTKG